MAFYDTLLNAFVTLMVTIDPPGLAPLFLALTRGMNRKERSQVGLRASLIAFMVLTLFAVAGAQILALFGITLGAFRIAGGLLLFWIAFEMIFERRNERKENRHENGGRDQPIAEQPFVQARLALHRHLTGEFDIR